MTLGDGPLNSRARVNSDQINVWSTYGESAEIIENIKVFVPVCGCIWETRTPDRHQKEDHSCMTSWVLPSKNYSNKNYSISLKYWRSTIFVLKCLFVITVFSELSPSPIFKARLPIIKSEFREIWIERKIFAWWEGWFYWPVFYRLKAL